MANSRNTKHPYIVVLAGDAGDVQKAMKFARKHQLMVSAQSSTIDPSGRTNSRDGGLSINLSNMKTVSTVETSGRNTPGEVVAQSGATWESVYVAARQYGRDIVAPRVPSLQVSIGSSIGDGGIGPLAKTYGMVSDNLLEAQIVMADGSLVTATKEYVTVDFGDGLVSRKYDWTLFAAATAGGIGPYGVVTAWTFKMVTAPAGVVEARLNFKLWEAGTYVGQEVLKTVVSVMDALPDSWSGFMYVDGSPSDSEIDVKGTLQVSLLYYGTLGSTPDYYFIDNLLNADFTDSIIVGANPIVNRSSVLEYERSLAQLNTQYRGYQFNVLLQPSKLARVVDADDRVTEALLFALNNPTIESGYTCLVQFLGGAMQLGAYENDTRGTYTYVSPEMRSAVASVTCFLDFPDSGVDDSYYISHALDFEELFQPFSEGKDRYYAEEDVPAWKKEFHGDMYAALIDAKLKYDIDNFFWCHQCVGSDFRIDCRYNDRHRGLLLSGYVNSLRAGRVFRANRRKDPRDKKIRQPYMKVMMVQGQ